MKNNPGSEWLNRFKSKSRVHLPNALQIMQLTFLERCFNLWRNGKHLGHTLREHCMNYFTPDELTISMMKTRAQVENSEGPSLALAMYQAVMSAERKQWESYSDEQAANVYNVWQARGYDKRSPEEIAVAISEAT